MFPVQIKIKEKKYLYIKWDDNSEDIIKLANLRKNCPCAICNSERENLGKNYIPLYSDNEVTLKKINMVGHYAFNLIWNDDHNTGIYEFERLKALAGS